MIHPVSRRRTREARSIFKMNGLSKESVTWVEIDEGSEGQRIDNFLFRHLKGVPKSHVYRILRGEVRVNKKRIDQTYRLQLGDLLRIPPIRVAEKPETASTSRRPNSRFCMRMMRCWPSTSPPAWRCMAAAG